MQIFRYLRKSWVAVTGCFLLLVVQAVCDLSLPTYTSNIVNVGITQGGIPDAVPEQMRGSTLATMRELMPPEGSAVVEQSYTADDDGIYHLNETADRAALNSIFRGVIVQEAQVLVGDNAYTPEEFLQVFQVLGTDMPLDESTLRLLYYDYFTQGETEPMTAEAFLRFLQNDVVNSPALGARMDEGAKAGIEKLGQFADAETLKTPMNAKALGGMFGMGEAQAKQLLLLYFTTYGGAGTEALPLRAFADFLVDDVSQNPEYANMMDKTTLAQVRQMQAFTDPAVINKPVTYTELAKLMGMDAEQVKLLYVYEKSQDSAYQPAAMTMGDFIAYLASQAKNPLFAAQLGTEAAAQLQLLGRFADKASIEKQRDSADMAALFGMETSAIDPIYALYRAAHLQLFNNTMSAKEFVDFVVSDVSRNPLFQSQFNAERTKQLTMLSGVMDAVLGGKKYTYAQIADLMGMDPAMIKLVFALRESETGAGNWKLSPLGAVTFLSENSTTFGSMLGGDKAAQIKMAQSLMQGTLAGKKYTPKELSTLLGMDQKALEKLFLLRQNQYGDTSGWKLPPYTFIDFMAKDVLTSETYASKMDGDAAKSLGTAKTLIDAVVSGKEYTSGQMAQLMSGFGGGMDAGNIEMLYLYYASTQRSEPDWKLSVTQLLDFLSNDVVNDPRFSSVLDEETKKSIASVKAQMSENISLGNVDFSNELVQQQVAVRFLKGEYTAIGMDMGKLQRDYMFHMAVQMILLVLLSTVVAIFATMLASYAAAKNSFVLRGKIYDKILSFSSAEIDQFSTASLITRSTNDIQQIQLAIALMLRLVLYAPILGVGGVIKVAQTHSGMGWVIAMAVGVVMAVVGVLVTIAMPKFKALQVMVDKVNLISREILTGLPVIRAFTREKEEEARFERANKALMSTQLFVNRGMSVMMPIMMFFMNAIAMLIIWVGGHRIQAGSMEVGDMMAFITYTIQIVMAFMMLSLISIILPRAGVAAQRVEEVLEAEPSIVNAPHTQPIGQPKGVVRFNDVSFHYPGCTEDVLKHITFTAKPGETTAIIGSTGSGKTTLVSLLPRLFDVTGGSVTLDGKDIRALDITELRSNIGFVPQKGNLFSGTMESNIKFSDEGMADAAMERAAEIAQAAEFIARKEEGYAAPIAQGGTNVSGGQKQRLSIARALARGAKVLVFDDSFSALDFKTDAALRRALAKNSGDATVIIVAQRISTVLHAQQIVVLHEGQIVGIGTHKELMERCEIYANIAKSQLNARELGVEEAE
ncbi:MAG: ABC transporter ATP-binding protein [Oscillospiraceae bacterium]|nr:ABC transporter ATP-binding protein [Oscillospiraceae bacterium]